MVPWGLVDSGNGFTVGVCVLIYHPVHFCVCLKYSTIKKRYIQTSSHTYSILFFFHSLQLLWLSFTCFLYTFNQIMRPGLKRKVERDFSSSYEKLILLFESLWPLLTPSQMAVGRVFGPESANSLELSLKIEELTSGPRSRESWCL